MSSLFTQTVLGELAITYSEDEAVACVLRWVTSKYPAPETIPDQLTPADISLQILREIRIALPARVAQAIEEFCATRVIAIVGTGGFEATKKTDADLKRTLARQLKRVARVRDGELPDARGGKRHLQNISEDDWKLFVRQTDELRPLWTFIRSSWRKHGDAGWERELLVSAPFVHRTQHLKVKLVRDLLPQTPKRSPLELAVLHAASIVWGHIRYAPTTLVAKYKEHRSR